MPKYIKASAFKKDILLLAADYGYKKEVAEILQLIDSEPSADVVEVVRCKDCRWGREACGNIECNADLNVPPEYHGYDWFCADGERRTDDGEVH